MGLAETLTQGAWNAQRPGHLGGDRVVCGLMNSKLCDLGDGTEYRLILFLEGT